MYNPARGLLYHPRNKNLSLGALTEAIYYSQVQGGEPAPELYDELRRIMENETSRATILYSRRLKKALDPKGILNPGKIIGE